MRAAAYPAYRSTWHRWLKQVPAHWRERKLKFAAHAQSSNVDKHLVDDEELVRLCNYTEVYNHAQITDDLPFMAATASQSEIEKFLLRAGDVIITKDSESWDDIAVPAWVPKDLDNVLCGYHLSHIRPNAAELDGAYLHLLLSSEAVNYQFCVAANGVTRFGLPARQIDQAIVLLPPLDEQRAIVRFLDAKTAEIDALIARKQRLLELLAEQRSALITKAVTKGLNPNAPLKPSGLPWPGDIPKHWQVLPLTKYLDSWIDYRGKTPRKTASGVFLVTAKNIKGGRIDYQLSQEFVAEDVYDEVMRRGLPEIGDVLLTTEAPLGEVAAIDRTEVALAQRVIKLCGRRGILDNGFLRLWMMSAPFQWHLLSYATGSTATGLKASRKCILKLLLPPIGEQRSIAEFVHRRLERIDRQVAKIEGTLTVHREFRSALITAAVTGQIDVRDWEPRKAAA